MQQWKLDQKSLAGIWAGLWDKIELILSGWARVQLDKDFTVYGEKRKSPVLLGYDEER